MKIYDVITSWKHNYENGLERKENVMIRAIGIVVAWDEDWWREET